MRRGRVRVLAVLALALTAAGCGDADRERAPAGATAASGDGVLVWAVGDADGGEDARALAGMVAATQPRLVLYLGDVYERGTAEDFEERFAPSFGRLAAITAPTPGNHEWPARAQGYRPYWRRVKGRPIRPWYETRAGGWQILALNSEAAHGPRSRQLRWLRTRLRRRHGTCRLAFWHRPRFSAGRHGDHRDVDPLWRAVAGRARLVLGAHDHDSQRLHPREGTTALVAGAGGRVLHEVDYDDPRLAFADDRSFAALRLRLRPGAADLAFVSAEGEVLDRSAVRCRRG